MLNLIKGMRVQYTGTQYMRKFENCKLLTGTIMEITSRYIDNDDYTEYIVKFDDVNFQGHSASFNKDGYYDNTCKSWFVFGKELTPVCEKGDNID